MVRLRDQLLIALVAPASIVLGAMAYFADGAVRDALDVALGERLIAVAQSAGTNVESRVVLVDRGDDDLRTVRSTKKKLNALIGATGVERILLVKIEDGTVLVDSSSKLSIGDAYVRAAIDASELQKVHEKKSAASVLFRGVEGRWYKSGYAPMGESAEAAVVVAAPAEFFIVIDRVRTTLGAIALLGFVALAALAFVSARRVSIPLSDLSDAADRIGQGELETDIPEGGPTETAVLAKTMSTMASSLRARDEEMQMMLGGIAHEVRNPLGGIELFGGLLKEDLEVGDPRRKHVDKILKEIGVLSKVVNDFLAFARKHELENQVVRVRDVAIEVTSMAKREAIDKNIEVATEVDRNLAAKIDPQSMNRALLNLVRNAIQATPEDGRVTLAAVAVQDELRISVTDTGPGIPDEKKQEIFTPFFTTKQKGTGLGLALVKKSVEAHGGQLTVEDGDDGGARFVITLPHDSSLEPPEEPGLLG